MVKRFLYLNGLAIIAVVLYHASAWGFIAMFWWTDRYRQTQVPDFSQMGGGSYYALRAIEQGIIFGIPAFLFVSGFFVAFATKRSQVTVSWQVIITRLRSLIIPFILWSALILVGDMLQGSRLTLSQIFTTVLTGHVVPPFYFIPLLIQLYLIAPFLVPLARSRWKLLLVATAIIQLGVLILRYVEILNLANGILKPYYFLSRGVLFPGNIFWFSLGIVFGFHLTEFKLALDRVKSILLIILLIFFVLGIFEWEYLLLASGEQWIGPKETLIDHIYAGFFIFSFLAFEKLNPILSEQLATLGSRSYGIYLVHFPVQEYTARLIYHVLPGLLAYQFLYQSLLIGMALIVPLIMMGLVNRSPARRYYEFVFGK